MRIKHLLAALCLLSSALTLPLHASERVPPAMRLGDAVQPVAYDLQVRVDPRQGEFSGRVSIDVDLKQPLDFFWLNATDLEVQDAVLVSGDQRLPARVVAGGKDFVGLQLPQAAPAGRARVVLKYRGTAATKDSRGLFQQHDRGNAYVFTHFEPLHARRAFPCFDEPHWKTPWSVTLTVPHADLAVANTAVAEERELPDGWKQVRFATTQPLPSYLVAFAAGPFDIVDAGSAGRQHTPMRIITPKGRAEEARYASQVSGRLLELLEDYFGMPYPFGKLDALAIPSTAGFSAMENPGLITYGSFVLLARPQDDNERFHQRYAAVAAHEMAHQWFGDLVTMQWWDDVWLNESFATWMSRKVVQQFEPAWDDSGSRESERHWAFSSDRLGSARQVRQPVVDRDDMEGAFDGITYAKGGAVLNMYEQWLGERSFREGVRRYLQRHRYGNAQARDFFGALAEADPGVAEGFSSFVLQPGLPLVDVALDCSGERPALQLRQQRFAPAATDPGIAAQRWRIPFCVRAEGMAAPQCTTLAERSERLELRDAPRCPAWVLPNPGGSGYFLSRLPAPLLATLPLRALSEAEAVSLLGEQSLLAASGGLPVAQVLRLAQQMATDARPAVAAAAATAVRDLPLQWFTREERRALAAWTRVQFGARARQLGWEGAQGESDAVRHLRRATVPLVADVGEDPQLRTQARVLALGWLADERRPLGGLRGEILRSAARAADAPFFDALAAAARKPLDSAAHYDILSALGTVHEPVLLHKALALGLAPEVDPLVVPTLYKHAAEEVGNEQATFAFVRDRYDALVARLPDEEVSRVPRWHENLCTTGDRNALRAFFTEPQRAQRPGSARALQQTLEQVDLCVRNAAYQHAAGGVLPARAGE